MTYGTASRTSMSTRSPNAGGPPTRCAIGTRLMFEMSSRSSRRLPAKHERPDAGSGSGGRYSRVAGSVICFIRLLREVADRLDVVAVGVAHERGVVVLVVFRSETGGAVVRRACGQRGPVERLAASPI